ncbi:MAG: hypothetical protein ACJ796_17170 [Gemmatimonadaceae bacterium]
MSTPPINQRLALQSAQVASASESLPKDSKWVVIGVVGYVPQEKARRATPPNVYLQLCTTVVLHDTTVAFPYTTMILADRVAPPGRCR